MKFIHIADVHIGSWREQKLRDLGISAFSRAVEECISEKVDFLLISGDLFNTSLPPLDLLKNVVICLKRLKDDDIGVYIVAGSHDFSSSGRSMLEVLEEVELFKNVCRGGVEGGKLRLKFTIDKKTGAKITGIIGKKGMLDRRYYESLIRDNLEGEEGFKIFMFHTAITELKPKELEKMESSPVSLLPIGFDYYAGGHVHVVRDMSLEGYNNVVFPGPVFPTSFVELEKIGCGGLYIYEDGKISYKKLDVCKILNIKMDCSRMTPLEVKEKIIDEFKGEELSGMIVTLRLFGVIDSGRVSDIDWKELYEILYSKNVLCVLKNTNKLASREFEDINIVAESRDETENRLIKENIGKIETIGLNPEDELNMIKTLIQSTALEREEGEKIIDYENRASCEVSKLVESFLEGKNSRLNGN